MLQILRSSLRTAFSSSARRGFTLIEIAIVLVVIGLIVSGGLLAVSPLLQSAKINETKQKMATVDAALLGYMITNGCLPCPARTGAGTGLPSADGTTDYSTSCNATTNCLGGTDAAGIVPWVALGISENDATDGWYRRLTYAVAPSRTATSSMQRNSSGSFPTFGTAQITITGATYSAVSYVLVSHGRNMLYGESNSGAAGATAGAGTAEVENGDNDLTFTNASPASDYDDIISFKSMQPLILSCGSGSCGNPS